jgi:hypothetical protein
MLGKAKEGDSCCDTLLPPDKMLGSTVKSVAKHQQVFADSP